MLGYAGILVLRRDFDEPVRILVGFGSQSTLLLRPVAEAISVQPGADLLAERAHREDGLGAAGGRSALDGGGRDIRTREGGERYPIFRQNETGKDLSAQATAPFARRGVETLLCVGRFKAVSGRRTTRNGCRGVE